MTLDEMRWIKKLEERLAALETLEIPLGPPRTVSTTNGTATTIHTIAIPASTTVQITAWVQARRTGGVAGTAEDGASYVRTWVYKTVAGTPTIIGAAATVVTQEDQAGWDVTASVSGSNVVIQVTGAVNNNINWSCVVLVRTVS